MDIALIAVPLCLALALIVVRLFELRKEKISKVMMFVRKLDVYADVVMKKVDNAVMSSSDVAYNTQKNLVIKIWNGLSHAVSGIKHIIDETHDKIQGKRNIKEKGHASFFFQSVSDHKESMKEGEDRPSKDV